VAAISRAEFVQTQVVTTLNEMSSVVVTADDIFYNEFTIRLTTQGRSRFVKLYDKWEFDLDVQLNAGQLIDLFRKMVYPYYLSTEKLILFSEEDAFMVKLAGVDGWLAGK